MVDYKETKRPFLSGIKLGKFGDSLVVECSLYMQLVGSLLYVTHTRNDLYYVVSVVEIYMKKPHEIYWKESKNILQYVQGTKNFKVLWS